MGELAGNGSSAGTGAGAMLRLIRDGRASTRADLVALTGLARSTVAQRMDALLAQRLVIPAGASASTGGRPPKTFAFNRNAGAGLAAALAAPRRRAPPPPPPAPPPPPPPKTFAFNRNAGAVLAADLGATHSRVAVTDL